jgi:type I site-specific restriction endonuclease
VKRNYGPCSPRPDPISRRRCAPARVSARRGASFGVFPHYRGEFARVITFKTEYAQSLIDNFSIRDKAPHIARSVDMLDTGIDVPEVVNLVFFKLVRSKTRWWC